jgi:glycosyltransferase involved in cell wall biosynthesis
LVFEYSLAHSTRYRQEIKALQDAGATVQLLTSHSSPEAPPPGVVRTTAPIETPSKVPALIPPSGISWKVLRVADDFARRVLRAVAARLERRGRARSAALTRLTREVDLFWVSDYLSLPAVMKAVRGTRVRVLYETIDLVPEFEYLGGRYRRRLLRGERRLIGKVNGFVTACDSYADYYVEKYGAGILRRRPVVRSDMPDHIAPRIRPVSRPLRILFLGALMFDRPIAELMEAFSLSGADATLTFQGKNQLGEEPQRCIARLGVEHKVRILEPCAPDKVVEAAWEFDVGIVALQGRDENERRASTTKLFTYMSAGLAVLGSDLPGIARVVGAHRNGMLVKGMDPKAWAAAVDDFAALSDSEIDAFKQRSLEAAREYAWERQEPAFIREFLRALGHSDAA